MKITSFLMMSAVKSENNSDAQILSFTFSSSSQQVCVEELLMEDEDACSNAVLQPGSGFLNSGAFVFLSMIYFKVIVKNMPNRCISPQPPL
jgi:hypothetical protein